MYKRLFKNTRGVTIPECRKRSIFVRRLSVGILVSNNQSNNECKSPLSLIVGRVSVSICYFVTASVIK
jgi:hypothetical protein